MLKQSIGIKTFSRIPDLGTGIQIISHIAIAQPYYHQHSHTSITTASYNTEKPLRPTSILIKKILSLKIRQKMIVSAIWLLESS